MVNVLGIIFTIKQSIFYIIEYYFLDTSFLENTLKWKTQ